MLPAWLHTVAVIVMPAFWGPLLAYGLRRWERLAQKRDVERQRLGSDYSI